MTESQRRIAMELRRGIAHPRQRVLDLAPSPLHQLNPRERCEVIALLAHLLLEAHGLVQGETDDERS
jgi:hypothetical protein